VRGLGLHLSWHISSSQNQERAGPDGLPHKAIHSGPSWKAFGRSTPHARALARLFPSLKGPQRTALRRKRCANLQDADVSERVQGRRWRVAAPANRRSLVLEVIASIEDGDLTVRKPSNQRLGWPRRPRIEVRSPSAQACCAGLGGSFSSHGLFPKGTITMWPPHSGQRKARPKALWAGYRASAEGGRNSTPLERGRRGDFLVARPVRTKEWQMTAIFVVVEVLPHGGLVCPSAAFIENIGARDHRAAHQKSASRSTRRNSGSFPRSR